MRYIRTLHGRELEIPVPDPKVETGTLLWKGGSADVAVSGEICTVPASVTATIPPPARPGEHTVCKLTVGRRQWEVHYLFDHSSNLLEAKYRWPQT